MKNKVIYNSFTSTCLYGLNIIVTFIMSPVIIRSLGNWDYGLWEIVLAVVGYMGLLDLGIGPALLRYVAVAHSNGNRKELQEIISTGQVFFICIGFVMASGLLVLSQYPLIFTKNQNIDISYIGTVFILFALNAGMSFPLNVFSVVLMGIQRHSLINITRGVLGIIRSIIAYMLLLRCEGKGLLVLAALEPIFNLIQFFIFAVTIHRDNSIPGFSMAACSLTKLKELFRYGSKSVILMVASRIQNASLPFVISSVLGVSNIVYFTMPNRLVDYAKGLSLAIGFPLTPYFASQMTGDDKTAVKISWMQTSLALQIITLAMPLFILFCGEPFLAVWIGKEYAIAGRGVLYCLVGALAIEAIAPNASRILMASGNHGRAALMWLVLSVVSVPLAVFGASRWGVTGVAMGSATALIIGNIVTLHMACCDVGATMAEYTRYTLFRLFAPLILLTASLWITTKTMVPSNYLQLALQVFISGLIYLISVWILTISNENRAHICEKIFVKLRNPINPVT